MGIELDAANVRFSSLVALDFMGAKGGTSSESRAICALRVKRGDPNECMLGEGRAAV